MTTLSAPFRQPRLRMCGLLATGVLTVSSLVAQSLPSRVRSEIVPSQMAVVPGSQHPLASPQNDAGRVPAGTRLNGITLYFSHTPAQQAEMNALMEAQQNPASPQYHKWLTPAQYAARFGLAQSDIAKVQAWLQQQGFSVDSVMHSATGIRFSGSAAQVESAFQTQMHYYNVAGEKHFAPSTALSVPVALSGVVAGVRNLDDFRPRPQHIPARRNFTSGSSGNVFFAPGDIATAYDINPLYQAGLDGTGQTIAIMGQSYVDVADVEAFQNAAGLKVKDPQLVLVPGTGNDGAFSKGDESESDLDLEWSSAIAPGANVVFVYTGSNTNYGVYDSAQYAIDNGIGNIISLSYSSCETEVSNASALTTLENIMQQGVLQGQTIMAASGDQGSTGCYGDTNLTQAQQKAVVVNYPASSAYVTGVGGTEIASGDGKGNSTYWQPASGSDELTSALKYIPEIVWNDDDPQYGLSATGGGPSSLVARPSWQTGVPGIPSGSKRLVPDIAFYSSPNAPGYLYCTSDQSAWGSSQVGSCTNGFRDSQSNLTVAGGTSFATPIFAGMVALLAENGNYTSGQQGGIGLLNPILYNLASNSTTYSTVFHDVTQGNNNCTAGATYCAQTTGFSAGPGYDEVTGLGSVDVANLATAFPASTSTLIGTSVSVVPATANPTSGSSDVFTITVTEQSTGNPVVGGTVTLQIDGGTAFGGTTLANQTLDANGTVSYTATFTGAGTHQVLAQFAGDATHAASTGVGEIIIPGGGGSGKIALSATDLSVKRGNNASTTITVTPSGGYKGTVLLTVDFGSSDTALQNLCYSFSTMDSQGRGTVDVPGSGAVTTQLNLDTNASDCSSSATGGLKKPNMRPFKGMLAGANHASNKGGGNVPAGLAFAGLLLAGLLGRHSRKLRNLACVMALVCAGLAISACGSSSGVNHDPPKGTYTGTVTGTDSTTSTITSQTNFTFTIQ